MTSADLSFPTSWLCHEKNQQINEFYNTLSTRPDKRVLACTKISLYRLLSIPAGIVNATFSLGKATLGIIPMVSYAERKEIRDYAVQQFKDFSAHLLVSINAVIELINSVLQGLGFSTSPPILVGFPAEIKKYEDLEKPDLIIQGAHTGILFHSNMLKMMNCSYINILLGKDFGDVKQEEGLKKIENFGDLDLSVDSLLAFRNFLYTERLDYSFDTCNQLLKFAQKIDCQPLKIKCLQLAKKNINAENLTEWLKIALDVETTSNDLLFICFACLHSNFEKLQGLLKVYNIEKAFDTYLDSKLQHDSFLDSSTLSISDYGIIGDVTFELIEKIESPQQDNEVDEDEILPEIRKKGEVKADRLILGTRVESLYQRFLSSQDQSLPIQVCVSEEAIKDFILWVYFKETPLLEKNTLNASLARWKELLDLKTEFLDKESLGKELENCLYTQINELIEKTALQDDELCEIQQLGDQYNIPSIVTSILQKRLDLAYGKVNSLQNFKNALESIFKSNCKYASELSFDFTSYSSKFNLYGPSKTNLETFTSDVLPILFPVCPSLKTITFHNCYINGYYGNNDECVKEIFKKIPSLQIIKSDSSPVYRHSIWKHYP